VDNGAITIIYDGDGNRVSKTVNGIITKYLVDNNNLTGYAQVFEELNAAGLVQRRYTYGLDLISQTQNAVTSYFGYDGHGSVRQLSDSLGSVTDTYDYDAFGILISRAGLTVNHYLFCGEQFDPDLGFYYLRARYMKPSTGRFMSMDSYEGSSGEPMSLHKYLYANADGVNCTDPTGNVTLMQQVQVIAMQAGLAAISAHRQLISAFQQGGQAVGQAFNFFGQLAQDAARQVLQLIPRVNIRENVRLGGRVVDFVVSVGKRVADIEVKYSLPTGGESYQRFIDQIRNYQQFGGGQTVVWTFRAPTVEALQRVYNELGHLAPHTQFVHGVGGLWQWAQFFFR